MIHGGNLHDAKAQFPEAPEPWIDLSTGINPTAYPFDLNEPDMREAFMRLPPTQALRHLETVAASAYGVADPARVAAAPGSQALLHLLPQLKTQCRVAIVGPTYNEHIRCWAAHGHSCVTVATPADALKEHADVIVIVNPNNPDGRIVAASELEDTAATLNARGGWLVVDEAFADLEDDVSIADRSVCGAIILRSFGKTYGLAGLRLGFAIAEPNLLDTIRTRLGLWAVSGPAIAIGAIALADRAWLDAQKDALRCVSSTLDDILLHAGFELVGGTRLFRLARHRDASDIFNALGRTGIWVRKFPFDNRLLRFGIPLRNELERLSHALNNSHP